MPIDAKPATPTVPESRPSSFRSMMDSLRDVKGDTPQWPLILRALLQAECLRQQPQLTPYKSTVAISRHDESPENARLPEKRAVRDLFHHCIKNSGSVFRIGSEDYLLLGWEWPNQGAQARMAADLVGLNKQGGLVVFEAKLPNNRDAPFTAVLEGLDYLVHLTIHQNFRQIVDAVAKWKKDGTLIHGASFELVVPSLSSRHEVIVLAPADYYKTYSISQRGHGWQAFRDAGREDGAFVDIHFAVTDFKQASGRWATDH